MRRKRLSQYSAYSTWSASQRSLESTRKPDLRTSDSSDFSTDESSLVDAGELSLSKED